MSTGYRAVRAQIASPAWRTPTASSAARSTTNRPRGSPPENVWSTERYLDFVPTLFARLRARVRRGRPPAPRRPPPADADRSGAPRQEPRAVPSVLAGRSGAGREPGGFSPDPPAHHDTARGRRDVQYDPRLPAADRGTAHRLHPHDHVVHAGGISTCARSRSSPSSTRQTGFHGATDLSPVCMAAALHFDLCGPELRHPGIHAPHARNRRGVPARVQLQRRRTCIRARRRGSAWTSTKRSPQDIPTSAPICR